MDRQYVYPDGYKVTGVTTGEMTLKEVMRKEWINREKREKRRGNVKFG